MDMYIFSLVTSLPSSSPRASYTIVPSIIHFHGQSCFCPPHPLQIMIRPAATIHHDDDYYCCYRVVCLFFSFLPPSQLDTTLGTSNTPNTPPSPHIPSQMLTPKRP